MRLHDPARRKEIADEALARARGGLSWSNFPAIMAGFTAKGIAEAEIKPRENVLTFHAWGALGRHVRRGEHGVGITTWIKLAATAKPDGTEDRPARSYCRTATVFHISQTDLDAPDKAIPQTGRVFTPGEIYAMAVATAGG